MTGTLSVTRATRQSEYIAALIWFHKQGIQVDAATAVVTTVAATDPLHWGSALEKHQHVECKQDKTRNMLMLNIRG
jgi:hypothetical protein